MNEIKTIEKIKELMNEKGWTKYKLAKMSGLPQSTITSLFSDRVKNPSTESLTKIANALGTTVSFLLSEMDSNDPVDEELSFGDYLRRARRKAGFQRQIHLAKASGISAPTISRLEDGTQKPTAETLVALSKPLELPVEQLMIVAGYLDDYQQREYFSQDELANLQQENANLKTQVEQLKEIISILVKGWSD